MSIASPFGSCCVSNLYVVTVGGCTISICLVTLVPQRRLRESSTSTALIFYSRTSLALVAAVVAEVELALRELGLELAGVEETCEVFEVTSGSRSSPLSCCSSGLRTSVPFANCTAISVLLTSMMVWES
jgi:hypothetical protein